MKKTIEFPTCWEEVQPIEFEYLLRLRQMLIEKKGISLHDIMLKWCDFVLTIRGGKKKNTQRYLLLEQLAKTLDWQWKCEDNVIELTFDSTINLLPKSGKYKGPASHGADLTFYQFRKGLAIVREFNGTHNNDCLVMLADILYPGSRGKFRAHILFGIYAWFAYFTQFIFTGTFIIDGKEICFSPIFAKSDDETEDDSIGMSSILFSVAESGVFGSAADVDKVEVLQVFLKLLNDKQQGDALLERMEK